MRRAIFWRRFVPFGIHNRVCSAEVILQGTHEFLAQAIHQYYLEEEMKKDHATAQNLNMVEWQELSEGI